MDISNIKRVYFLGIGGIGMSAIARFFLHRGATVSGYDKTPTALTAQLEAEGMRIHFEDDINLLDRDAQLVIYTPAIPAAHLGLNWYRDNNYPVFKRSDALQWITESLYAVTVAGTHGKTTLSTMTAYLLRETGYGCNAFLGGIAVNYETNYWYSPRQVAVIEADEYDRSFLKLRPDFAVLTAIDPDHLDIYGTPEAMEEAFIQYTRNIKPGGTLLVKSGLHRATDLFGPNTLTYSLNDDRADIYASGITSRAGGYDFTLHFKGARIEACHLPIGGLHNVENSIAALSAALTLGVEPTLLIAALAGFKGVKRRFEYVYRDEQRVFIDDYAHHPEELSALIRSARDLFPGRKCVVCFQPHLFTRTRDLVDGFAASLDLADEVLLLDIYPARELPIEGVTSKMIADRMHRASVQIVSKAALAGAVAHTNPTLLITAGAGDIDKLVSPLKQSLCESIWK
jgi:UDP-N-acetylmuramate--alanine ligase